jgi:NHL repeat
MVGLWRTTMGTMAAAVLAMGIGSGPATAQDSVTPATATDDGESPDQWQIWDILDRLLERTLPKDGHSARKAPGFVVDPGWPLTLPNKWLVGQVGGIAVDRHDNIWILQRARTLTSDEAGALGAYVDPATGETATIPDEEGGEPIPVNALGQPRPFGPIADCCIPAPAVMQFDPDGNLLQAWGGPADEGYLGSERCREEDGCVWPATEHGIFVDHNDNVYIAGNGTGEGGFPWAATHGDDSHVLKFSSDGTFLLRVGDPGFGGPANSNDTAGASNGTPQLYNPADTEVDPKTNELYIADGYGNHRIVVVDAETGLYKRHWGAYGQNPVDDAASDEAGDYAEDRDAGVIPTFFRNPVHCVRVAKDGLVYVCDRTNNRLQVFKADEVGAECSNPDGEEGQCGFVAEKHIRPDTLGPGSVWDLDTSSDRRQSCLHNVDGTNQHADILHRRSLEILATWGRSGRNAGEFHWVHNVATDSEGNLYTAEVDTGKRAQKFVRYGPEGCRDGHRDGGDKRDDDDRGNR